MARHGEHIHKRKDGRWEGRYGIYDEAKGKIVYQSVYAKSYIEVKKKLTINKSTSIPKIVADITPIMIDKVAEAWLEQVKNCSKHSTYIKYRYIYKKYLEKSMPGMDIRKINNSMIINRIFGVTEEATVLSESQQRSIFFVLNQILIFAAEKHSIPIEKLKKTFWEKKKCKTIEIFNQSEQIKLITYLYENMDIYKLGILLCLSTGLRLGEICAIRWEDIDLAQKILSVKRTVQRISIDNGDTKTKLMETLPKTAYSKREIPLSPHMDELLLQNRGSNIYLLHENRPIEPRTYQNKFKAFLKGAGIAERNFHVLRHTFATNCINNGIDTKSLSEILGHSDVKITLNRYVHPSMETKRRYMDSLSEVYGQYRGHQ